MDTYKKIQSTMITVILLAACGAQTAGSFVGSGTTDKEITIDVEQLKANLHDATSGISERLHNSTLIEKFDEVSRLLQNKNLDKEQLLQALENVQGEIAAFLDDWNEVTEPLWDAQASIGETIERVRDMLARTNTKEPSEEMRAMLKTYDQRLANLAKTIEQEKNEDRKQRLKIVFANVLSLRELAEKAGMVDLGPAQENLYVKIIESLSNLEVALTNATFQVEKTRIVLSGHAEFIGNYLGILRPLIKHEELARIVAQMNRAGDGIGLLGGDLGELTGKCHEFTEHMNALAERLVTSISDQTASAVQISEFSDEQIEQKIQEYSRLNE